MPDFRILDKQFVEENLDMPGCIKAMEDCLLSLHRGGFVQYLRTSHVMPCGGLQAFMPAYSADGYFGAKLLSIFPKNSSEGYPSHQGQILIFESGHGVLQASVDATSVTKIRTAAVSAAATKLLARPDAKIMTIFGAGEQAESHLEAISCVRQLEEVRIWNHNFDKAERFCRENAALAEGARLIAVKDPDEACEGADIICTLTASPTPLFKAESVKPGAHINAVGACRAECRELDDMTVKNARFFCDSVESVMAEAGDFLFPLKAGIIKEDHLLGTLGQLLAGEIKGRKSDSDVTIYESLGLAAEDLASARYLLDKAGAR